MAEINLLKNPGSTRNHWQLISTWLLRLLAVLVLAVIVYYGFLFFKVKSTSKDITQTEASMAQSKAQALSMPGRDEFLTTQSQLKEFIALSQSHSYYSKFLPALAKVTLKTAYYNNITVNNQGKLVMQVVVPSLGELDKFLQVFDQPDISKNFYNVRLGGFSKAKTENGEFYTFSVQLDFNLGLWAAN